LLRKSGVSHGKSVRFDALVKSSGQPEQVTLWTKPEDDADFMKAVKQNRVATIVQTNVGTKKDFGVVGFEAKKNAAYLVFPKSVSAEKGSKIVGIKYERLAEAEPKGPIFKPKRKSSPGIPMKERRNYTIAEEVTEAAEQEEPRLFSFRSEVILTAIQKTEIEVEAASASAAAKLIQAQAEEVKFDVSAAKIGRKIGKTKKVQRKG
jgi:hypothetical protein